MATIERFEDILVWQKARILSLDIYKSFSQNNDFGFQPASGFFWLTCALRFEIDTKMNRNESRHLFQQYDRNEDAVDEGKKHVPSRKHAK